MDVAAGLLGLTLLAVFRQVNFRASHSEEQAAGAVAVGVLTLASAAFLLARHAERGQRPTIAPSVTICLFVSLAGVAGIFAAHLATIAAFPVWSEGVGWLEIGRAIAEGTRANPFIP